MSTLKVGTTERFYFYYANATTLAPVTGAADGDFTRQITKNGTGNQSTTGCTITEVDATNNPGVYCLTVSGTTGFMAATGKYHVKLYVTADNTLVWTTAIDVTSDGTGAGSWGDAAFTATASNGRLMAGGSPLASATVRILDPNGNLYVQTTSGATGLWGPVYFNADGTYTIYAQKTGYTTATGTIVVSGSTATGPGADLTLVAGTSSTTSVATLMAYVRRVMVGASGTTSDVVNLEVINEAAEMLAMERQWEWFHERGAINLHAPYSTGTVTATNGSAVVTLAGGTFPSWAASADILIDDVWVPVLTRDSDTQVTLDDTWGGDSGAYSYSIAQTRYALPSDCVRVQGIHFGPGWPFQPEYVSAPVLEHHKATYVSGNDPHWEWTIQRDKYCIWPPPTADRHVSLLYFRKPAQVTGSGDTLDWPADQVVVLRRAIDYIAAMRGATVMGSLREAKDAYEAALSAALPWDRTIVDSGVSLSGQQYDDLFPTINGTIV